MTLSFIFGIYILKHGRDTCMTATKINCDESVLTVDNVQWNAKDWHWFEQNNTYILTQPASATILVRNKSTRSVDKIYI